MYFLLLRSTVITRLLGLLIPALVTSSAFAHEFWIEPTRYQLEQGSELEAYFRNGENFSGSTMAYISPQTNRFDLITGEGVNPVIARLGDNPALKMQSVQAGLNIVVHHSTASVITYAKWEKFQRFADHKDFANIQALHRERLLPETNFGEAYSRFSKTLIAVADGAGSDVQTGLEIELVAMQNPYTDKLTGEMQVIAYYQDKIRANAQIELFEKSPTGDVNVTLHRTDEQGVVELPVKRSHSYLVDMVVLRAPSEELAEQKKVVWETLWASLTFAVP